MYTLACDQTPHPGLGEVELCGQFGHVVTAEVVPHLELTLQHAHLVRGERNARVATQLPLANRVLAFGTCLCKITRCKV